MPILLDHTDVVSQLDDCRSVLIVPCRFCPAVSMAVRNHEPYIRVLHDFLETAPYRRHIEDMRRSLSRLGMRVTVFRSRWPHQFVLCMWTCRRRRALQRRAAAHDAVVVLGCEAATQSVRDAVASTSCRVIQGMESQGVMSLRPSFHLSGSIVLELESVSPLVERGASAPLAVPASEEPDQATPARLGAPVGVA